MVDIYNASGWFLFFTRDWIVNSNLLDTDYYKEFNLEEGSKPYSEPGRVEEVMHWRFLEEIEGSPPPAFVAVIPNGRVCGAKGAVITPDNKLVWDLSIDYLSTPATHPILQFKELPPIRKISGTAAVLTFSVSSYYYHWMFDVLPRIELLRKRALKADIFIINDFLPRSFQEQTLRILDIPLSRVKVCGNDFHLMADRLVVPSLTGYTGHMPKWACEFLRKTFLAKNFLKKKGYNTLTGCERIYISREKAKMRKVINEGEVVDLLSSYGFKKVYLEFMPFEEQVRLFSSAEMIVSPHGGGLTNLVFCKPGTRVLEFFSPGYVNVLYWILSNHLKLDYYYIIGEGSPPADRKNNMVWDSITVNIDKLAHALEIA